MHPQVLNTGGSCEQDSPCAPSRAPTGSTAFFTRSNLASHLKLSARSVDRFIERHRLKTASGRPVFVRLEHYARRLVTLRGVNRPVGGAGAGGARRYAGPASDSAR